MPPNSKKPKGKKPGQGQRKFTPEQEFNEKAMFVLSDDLKALVKRDSSLLRECLLIQVCFQQNKIVNSMRSV